MPQMIAAASVVVQVPATESALVGDLVAQLPAYLKNSCVIAREVGVGRSIADVVVGIGAAPRTATAVRLSVREAVVVHELRRGATRIDVLENRCALPKGSLRGDALRRLTAAKVITRTKGGRIALRRTRPCLSLIAIEAKLTRWVEALQQAIEYRRFADKVYVALPAATVDPAVRSISAFRRAGVGLMAVNGAIETILNAAPSTEHDWHREYVYSRLIDAASRGNA